MIAPCPSCSVTIDLARHSICPHCAWQFQESPTRVPIVKSARRQKIPMAVELGVTVDRTDSSRQFTEGISSTLKIVFAQVTQKASSLRVFLQSHGDLDLGEQPILHSDGATPEQALADLPQIVFQGGGDPAEHHLDAIEHLWKIVNWSFQPTQVRSAILCLLNADTKPTRSGITAAQLGEQIRQQGILLYLVCQPTPQLWELTEAAAGLIFEISNTPDPAELNAIALQLAASIAVGAHALGSGTVPLIR